MGATYEFPRSIDVLAEFTLVVREIGVGARCAEVFIVRGHPLEMDANALHTEGDELSVEERPLQKPALVFDLLAREAGELGLRTTVSAGLADFGQDFARDPFRKRLASGFRLVKMRLNNPDWLIVMVS